MVAKADGPIAPIEHPATVIVMLLIYACVSVDEAEVKPEEVGARFYYTEGKIIGRTVSDHELATAYAPLCNDCEPHVSDKTRVDVFVANSSETPAEVPEDQIAVNTHDHLLTEKKR